MTETDDIHKYCHVSTFISNGNSNPTYKQTFRFKVSSNTHHKFILDEITSLLEDNGIEVELKS